MKRLQSFESFEKLLKSCELPKINFIDEVVYKVTDNKRIYYKKIRSITSIAAIVVILVFSTIGAYAAIDRLQVKSKEGNVSYSVIKVTEDKYIKGNQGNLEMEKLSGYVDNGENILIGFLDSKDPELYGLGKPKKIVSYDKAKEEIDNKLDGFLKIPNGYTFRYAYINYRYERSDEKTCKTYIDEAIKNKQEVVKIPMKKLDEVSDISYSISKKTNNKKLVGESIRFEKSYSAYNTNNYFEEIYQVNNKIDKIIIENQEVIIKTKHNLKEISWVEEFNSKKVFCRLTVPVRYTAEEITDIVRELTQ